MFYQAKLKVQLNPESPGCWEIVKCEMPHHPEKRTFALKDGNKAYGVAKVKLSHFMAAMCHLQSQPAFHLNSGCTFQCWGVEHVRGVEECNHQEGWAPLCIANTWLSGLVSMMLRTPFSAALKGREGQQCPCKSAACQAAVRALMLLGSQEVNKFRPS